MIEVTMACATCRLGIGTAGMMVRTMSLKVLLPHNANVSTRQLAQARQ